ncbi:MAG: ABC transporter ATP-binding protein [Hasllibacter sp.]
MDLPRKAYRLLTPPERREAWGIVAISVVVAMFEALGALSIMPFLAVLADPGQIERNDFLAWVYAATGLDGVQPFLVLLGVASFLLLLVSAGSRALGMYVIVRFSNMRAYSISRRLMETYLRRPHAAILGRHSSEMTQRILGETMSLVNSVYMPMTGLVSNVMVATVLLVLLVTVDPVVAVIAFSTLGICYAAIYVATRSIMTRYSRQRFDSNRMRFRIANETFGGMKILKLLGRETVALARFSRAARDQARSQSKIVVLGQLPRFAIEAVAFGGIILLSLALLIRYGGTEGGGVGEILPLLGLYAFVGYRLMPALQGIYGSLTQLRSGVPPLNAIADDLLDVSDLTPLQTAPPRPLTFSRDIALEGIGFRHEGADAPALEGIDLVLPKGGSLGVVGTTGAGKSTLMDVFLGLLKPEAGRILVDGREVGADAMRAWQANMGYVPQDIFLAAGSVAENVAFSMPAQQIDRDRVVTCARMAQLDDFVREQLPEGYDTSVGERGVRLSGGQRQRVGIARALYHDPEVLVFDEATSALDPVTERAVVETIAALGGTKTMLIVAHRLDTIRDCDRILVLERGRMAGLGSYDELREGNAVFRRMLDARAAA